MRTLRIYATGLPPDSLRVFHSMLKVIEGRSLAAWRPGAMAQADVLLAHAGADPVLLDEWDRTGKPVLMVVDERAPWLPARFVLRLPFRVMQLLSLLDEVAAFLAAPPAAIPMARQSRWAAAESLRALMARGGESGWQVATGSDGHQLWIGATHAAALPEALIALRAGALQPGAFARSDASPPVGAIALAVADVAWFIGLNGPAELAPWLQAEGIYRLRRWPDLARLGADEALIELCACAAARERTSGQLAASAGVPAEAAQRFLVAASLAGLLASASREQEPARPVAAEAVPASGWSRLIGDLRRHLRRAA
ncbi:MAG: hypothetical protein J0H15_03310 [Xanthomonadales bacterium]|nr:hypothetical protein [Xanthomonadales bacterium]